jgi:hypothetical protein
MGLVPDKLRTPGCGHSIGANVTLRGGLTRINKLNRSPYSKPTNEVAAHVVVGKSSTVGVSVVHRSAPES